MGHNQHECTPKDGGKLSVMILQRFFIGMNSVMLKAGKKK